MSALLVDPEVIHPSLWRASSLARGQRRTIDTGFPALSNQLVGGGWPLQSATELLLQQNGISEMRLLAPALRSVAHRRIILLQPPHSPQILSLAGMGLNPTNVIWLKSETTADALWAAEQVLRGNCGALLYWAKHVRSESLRRLHLASQSGETLFFVLRPLASAQDPSPAPLRLSVRPASGGVDLGFVKRQGPQRVDSLFLPLPGYVNAPIVREPQENREPVITSAEYALPVA